MTRGYDMLTVLNVAYPFSPVGDDAVGGSEQILRLLDGRARQRGSHLAGSSMRRFAGCGPTVPGSASRVRGAGRRRSGAGTPRSLKRAIDRALLLYRVDLVHMHGLDFYEYNLPPSIPVLVTLHLPIAWYGIERLKRLQSRVQLCCVSRIAAPLVSCRNGRDSCSGKWRYASALAA